MPVVQCPRRSSKWAVLGAELAWFDRAGKEIGERLPRDSYRDPSVSPDGRKLAVALGDPLRTIWIIDLAQGKGCPEDLGGSFRGEIVCGGSIRRSVGVPYIKELKLIYSDKLRAAGR